MEILCPINHRKGIGVNKENTMQEKKLEDTFKEILTDQLSSFSYEETSGMVIKFCNSDSFTELIFGNLEIYFNNNILKIDNEKQLDECTSKNYFICKDILNIKIETGDLIFIFDNKNKLIFKHSDNVENWELRWRSKITIVSIPGGKITFF
jgi:hypothetical protein